MEALGKMKEAGGSDVTNAAPPDFCRLLGHGVEIEFPAAGRLLRGGLLPVEGDQLVALAEIEAELVDRARLGGLADEFDLGSGNFRGAQPEPRVRRDAAGDVVEDFDR